MNEKPPCAKWKAWLGNEIEGQTHYKELTLFVRAGDVLTLLDHHTGVNRVWLCKEFLFSHCEASLTILCRKLRLRGVTVAVEVPLSQFREYGYLRPFVNYYIKVELNALLPGDHICVGPAFSDEAFLIGTGVKVAPEQYLDDVEIK